MKERIKAVPLPLSGVMLGFAALGNLLQSYSAGLRLICGVVSGLLLLLLLLKLVLFPALFQADMKNPILASVAGTLPMGMMLLSVYLKPVIGPVALAIWLFAIGLHVALIVYFTVKFMVRLELSKVFASYFIVYVGIVAASVTAPAYGMAGLGTVLFWFGLATLLLLLILVTARYLKLRVVPEPAQPLFCIYAAPTSLCLVGYLQSVQNKSLVMVVLLAVVATVLYAIALVKLVSCLRLPFYPSYASFTFPLIISAIAIKQTAGFLVKAGIAIPALQYLVLAETVIAVIAAVYVLIRFLPALIGAGQKAAVKAAS